MYSSRYLPLTGEQRGGREADKVGTWTNTPLLDITNLPYPIPLWLPARVHLYQWYLKYGLRCVGPFAVTQLVLASVVAAMVFAMPGYPSSWPVILHLAYLDGTVLR